MSRCEKVLLKWPGHPNTWVEDGMLAIVGAQQLHVLSHPTVANINLNLGQETSFLAVQDSSISDIVCRSVWAN